MALRQYRLALEDTELCLSSSRSAEVGHYALLCCSKTEQDVTATEILVFYQIFVQNLSSWAHLWLLLLFKNLLNIK